METPASTEDSGSPVPLALSEEMVKSIRCSFCEKYLSVPPIYITSPDGKKYKCGRCKVKSFIHCKAVMYEKLAKYMSFPCIYKGCTELTPFKDVAKHEEVCGHRSFRCIARSCKQEFLASEFAKHIKESHEKIYYKDSISLKNAHQTFGLCFLEQMDQCYVILFDVDNVSFGISVSSLQLVNKRFDITLSSPESKSFIKIKDRKIELFDRNRHCYECIRGVCDVSYHEHRSQRNRFLKNMDTVVGRDLIVITFGKSPVIYKIDIVDEILDADVDLGDILLEKDIIIDDADEEEVEDEQEEAVLQKQAEVFKQLFECSVADCNEQLSPPIFQCLTGHSVCSSCKSKSETCPTCEAKIETTRNFVLEEIDANLKQTKPAEPVDSDKTITCPFSKCLETYSHKGISEHFLQNHTENMHYNVATIKNVYSLSATHVLVKNEKPFLIQIDFDDGQFGVGVFSLDKDEHQYEITLSSQNNKYSITATRQKICTFEESEHCFKCLTGFCKNDAHPNRKRKKYSMFRKLVTKFPRLGLRATFETACLGFKIKIVEPKGYVEKDKVLRQALECPICHYYMVPPIHQCVSGHTLCNSCRGKLSKCPTCEAEIKDTHNVSLETAAETAEVSCQNEGEQCAYRANLKKVTAHEADCRRNGTGTVNKKPCLAGDNR